MISFPEAIKCLRRRFKIKLIFFFIFIVFGYSNTVLLNNILGKVFKNQDKNEKVLCVKFLAISDVKTFNKYNELLKTVISKRYTIISNIKPKFITNKYITMNINSKDLSKKEIIEEIAKNSKRKKKSFQKLAFHSDKRDKYLFSLLGETNFKGKKVYKIGINPKADFEKENKGYYLINKNNYNILYCELMMNTLPTIVKKFKIKMNFTQVKGLSVPIESYVDVSINLLYMYRRNIKVTEKYSNYQIFK